MGARAGIVVTGTEVLTGRVTDRNGPWLAERLRLLGVDVGQVVVVGDRREDLAAALRHLAVGHDLVITTGGLGPTADDLTAEVVAEVQGRPLRLDPDLEARIAARVASLTAARGWGTPSETMARGVRKQAMVPERARVLEPVGTAPGLVVPAEDGPPVLVLPGPPGELRPMWEDAVGDALVLAALGGREELRQATVRIWGPPEAELAEVLRGHEDADGLDGLEITTCLREGELEVVTRYAPDAQTAYDALERALVAAFGGAVYSTDGRTVDEVVFDLFGSTGATLALAESCTAGLLAGRVADVPGSSAHLVGGFVTYADAAKTALVGVPEDLLRQVGAVSPQVAEAMARGARERLGTTWGVGVTGVAGPGGGTPEKPVGLVHVCASSAGRTEHRRLLLGGSRDAVRARTVAECLHLLREVLGDAVSS
ncbi:competence/damage-inducible protein A [Arthrobacter sp. NEB 688]|uniref:competence/damage-inducible protein A n=1 Tax=Arthrobacter sp. NEB 688 TaxID=904039 RepID=UPI001564BF22|nr:competence/damage-inducible protein A [Arthrobacter sp. NEB 688]QKE84656.1 competence/damage-inducible protein A [Arthrobacter sp. NEB 688]